MLVYIKKGKEDKFMKNSSLKKLLGIGAIVVTAAAVAAVVVACTQKKEEPAIALVDEDEDDEEEDGQNTMMTENVKIKVEMENGGSFVMELYPEYAPQTVQNFVDLVEEGFYDGVGFHRVIDGFMAQGGDPDGTGMGGSGTHIPGEFAANGFPQNTLSHQRGVVSMARAQDPDSASSQFFICYDDASFLDGQYAAFGKVIEGMEVVDSFLEVERVGREGGTPTEPITMKSVTVID